MFTRVAFAVAVSVGFVSASACAAAPGPRYALKRIPMGPRPDQYVLVRVDRAERADRPYRLTGKSGADCVRQKRSQPMPSHPKGTH